MSKDQHDDETERVGPAPGTDCQLVISGAEWVEREDGTRELVDGELESVVLLTGEDHE